MTISRAAAACALWLATAWVGCAASPSPERDVSGQDEEPTPPTVVVSELDAGRPRFDASRPTPPSADADTPSDDAASFEPGRPDEEPEPTDAGSEPPAVEDAEVEDAQVVDAGAPVEAQDAGERDAGKMGCLPGTYEGSFKGEISALLGAIRIDVAGRISIDVELSGTGDRLRVRTGVLQGTDTSEDKNPLFARIGGVLNCATKMIEDGTITDGTYNRVDPIWGGPPMTTTFSGTIGGVYSTSPPAAVGTWMVRNATGTRTSMGTWDAALR